MEMEMKMKMGGLPSLYQTKEKLSHPNSFQSETQRPRHHTNREAIDLHHPAKGKRREMTVVLMSI